VVPGLLARALAGPGVGYPLTAVGFALAGCSLGDRLGALASLIEPESPCRTQASLTGRIPVSAIFVTETYLPRRHVALSLALPLVPDSPRGALATLIFAVPSIVVAPLFACGL
jgi:hypothetical protein